LVVGRAEALVVELAVVLVVDLEAAQVTAVDLVLAKELVQVVDSAMAVLGLEEEDWVAAVGLVVEAAWEVGLVVA
jgi:hypothetical protein